MDPEQTIREMLQFIRERNIIEARQRFEDLMVWISKGGFITGKRAVDEHWRLENVSHAPKENDFAMSDVVTLTVYNRETGESRVLPLHAQQIAMLVTTGILAPGPLFPEDRTLRCPEDVESAEGHYDPSGTGEVEDMTEETTGLDGAPLCAGCGCEYSEHGKQEIEGEDSDSFPDISLTPRLKDSLGIKPLRMTCTQPDRDNPKLQCGYPIPCPHHTFIIDKGEVEVPPIADAQAVEAVKNVAKACADFTMDCARDMNKALDECVTVEPPKDLGVTEFLNKAFEEIPKGYRGEMLLIDEAENVDYDAAKRAVTGNHAIVRQPTEADNKRILKIVHEAIDAAATTLAIQDRFGSATCPKDKGHRAYDVTEAYQKDTLQKAILCADCGSLFVYPFKPAERIELNITLPPETPKEEIEAWLDTMEAEGFTVKRNPVEIGDPVRWVCSDCEYKGEELCLGYFGPQTCAICNVVKTNVFAVRQSSLKGK